MTITALQSTGQNRKATRDTMRSTTAVKTRIVWTDDELDILADEMARLRLEDPLPNLLALLRQAQEKLPVDRTRTIQQLGQAQDLVDKVVLRIESFKIEVQKGREPPPDARKVLDGMPEKEFGEYVARRLPVPPPPTPEEVLGRMSKEEVLAYMTARLPAGVLLAHAFSQMAQVVLRIEQTQAAVTDMATAVAEHLTSSGNPGPSSTASSSSNGHAGGPTPARPARPRIAVVGLKPGQVQQVAAACSEVAELHFVTKDRRAVTFPSGAEYVVLFTKWIGHDADDAALKHFPRERVHRHGGGITEGINLIRRLAASHKN
jgi:hypothetical protein